jgi:ribonuclease P protein component
VKRLSFTKEKRLLSNRQFKAVLVCGVRSRDELFTLYIAGNNKAHPRLGVSVKRSCGNSVVRNRLKRLVREAFRQSQDVIPVEFDYVVMTSPKLSADLHRKDCTREVLKRLTFERVRVSFLKLVENAVKRYSRTGNGKSRV